MPFTNEEAFEMLAVYFECLQSVYATRFRGRHRDDYRLFTRLAHRLRTTGSIHRPVLPRFRSGGTEENVINILAYVEFNPHLSTWTISMDLEITRTTVRRILKERKFHSYHVVLHQALSHQDFERRLDHCHWLPNMIRGDHQFLTNILWTDEATFNSNGGVSSSENEEIPDIERINSNAGPSAEIKAISNAGTYQKKGKGRNPTP
ncbi:hypothetical protein HUJ04_004213 [Dendroctonus ponderosae]|nr:hypothetical protein HUJ04_004213 [Dendroctonus ponderosae]